MCTDLLILIITYEVGTMINLILLMKHRGPWLHSYLKLEFRFKLHYTCLKAQAKPELPKVGLSDQHFRIIWELMNPNQPTEQAT